MLSKTWKEYGTSPIKTVTSTYMGGEREKSINQRSTTNIALIEEALK